MHTVRGRPEDDCRKGARRVLRVYGDYGVIVLRCGSQSSFGTVGVQVLHGRTRRRVDSERSVRSVPEMRNRRPAGPQTPESVFQRRHNQTVRQRVVPSRQTFHRQRRTVRLQGPALFAAAGDQEIADVTRPSVRRLPVAVGAKLSRVVLHNVHHRAKRKSDRERNMQHTERQCCAKRTDRQLGDAFHLDAVVFVRHYSDFQDLRIAFAERHTAGV